MYSAPVINGRIDDSGMIEWQLFSRNQRRTWRWCCEPERCRLRSNISKSARSARRSARTRFAMACRRRSASLVVVMIFMVIYYRLSGVNAVVALILNLIILVAFMAYAGAVLTLPGIAGVILTIGMGVDSNVLVFERIREELRNGKAPASAVDAGIRSGFSDDHRHARHHGRVGHLSVSLRYRAGAGICRHLDDRFDRQRVYFDLRVASDFRLPPVADGPPGGTEYLECRSTGTRD